MGLRDVVIRSGERYLSAPEIDEINSHVRANIRDKKKSNAFLADNGPSRPGKGRDLETRSAMRRQEPHSFKRTDGPIEDPQRLDRIGPFCGAVEWPVLSVLSTFGHASMMSTGIAWTASGRSLKFRLPTEILTSRSLSHLSHSRHISNLYRCTVSLITNCLRELPLATLDSSTEGTPSRLSRLVTTTSGVRLPLCLLSRF